MWRFFGQQHCMLLAWHAHKRSFTQPWLKHHSWFLGSPSFAFSGLQSQHLQIPHSCNFEKQGILSKNYQGLPVHRTLCSALLHVFSRQALLYIFSRQPLGNISSWETCVAFSLHLRWLWWVKILLLHQPLLQNPAIITAPMQAEITVLSWLH